MAPGCHSKESFDKYGEDHLKAMVQAGTIQTRRLVTDQRFFEFRAVQQKDSTEITGKKGIDVRGGQRAISNEEVAAYSVMNVSDMVSTDFDFDQIAGTGNSSGSAEDDLAKALKIKDKKKLPIKDKSHGTALDKKWETMSKIEPGDSKTDIKKKILEFKTVMMKEETAFNTMALTFNDTKNKKGLSIANSVVGELQNEIGMLNTLLKNPNVKREDQKKVLMTAFALLNQTKAKKKDLRAMLPKKAKNQKDEEPDAGEDDE